MTIERSRGPYKVETGKGKGSYQTLASCPTLNTAIMHYNCYLTHSGGKKRIKRGNKVLMRQIS